MFVCINPDVLIRKCQDNQILLVNKKSGFSLLCSPESEFFIDSIPTRPLQLSKIAESINTQFPDIPTAEIESDFLEFLKNDQTGEIFRTGDTLESVWEYALSSLHIEITYACNERCIHCYIPEHSKNNSSFLDFSIFCKTIDEFSEMGGREVTISGGEPLLHPQFREIIKECRKRNLQVNIFSNLILCNEKLADFFKSQQILSVQTSLYAMDPTIHDQITKVNGSFDRTMKGINLILGRGINLDISTPIMAQNEKNATEIIDFAKTKKIGLRINPMLVAQTDGNTSNLKNTKLFAQQQTQFWERLLHHDCNYVKDNLLELNLQAEKQLIENSKLYLNGHICSAGIDHLCISSSGEAYPCAGWEKFIVGNIFQSSLSDIWYNSDKLAYLRKINNKSYYQKCITCEALNFCKRCFMLNSLNSTLEDCFGNSCESAFSKHNTLKTLLC